MSISYPITFTVIQTNKDHLWHCFYAFRRNLLRRSLVFGLIFIVVFLYLNYVRWGEFPELSTYTPTFLLMCFGYLILFLGFAYLVDLTIYFIQLRRLNKRYHPQSSHKEMTYSFFEDHLDFKSYYANSEIKHEVFQDIYIYKDMAVLKIGCNQALLIPYRCVDPSQVEDFKTLLNTLKKDIKK